MLESHAAGDALVRLESNHLGQQVNRRLVHTLDMTYHWYALPLRECRFEIGVLQSLGPVSLTWCSLHLKYFKDLVDF